MFRTTMEVTRMSATTDNNVRVHGCQQLRTFSFALTDTSYRLRVVFRLILSPFRIAMSLAKRLKTLREAKDYSIDDLAKKSGVSRTYLWELEKDETNVKKPSADILLKIATAMSTTIADLLSQPMVRVAETEISIPASLQAFREQLKSLGGEELSEEDVRDLALVKFRGAQPASVAEWFQLYSTLKSTQNEKKKS